MKGINIINIGTANDAQKDYNNFLYEAKQHNKKCTLWTILIICLWAVSVVSAELVLAPGFVRNLVQVVLSCIAYIFICGFFDNRKPTTPYFFPATYQYHEMLSKYKVLNTNIHHRSSCCDVEFTVADKDCKVLQIYMYNFLKETRSNISEPTIDLANRTVYEPYI